MVAPRKSISTLSLIPEERSRNMPSSSSKSTESLYSNTSSSKGSATILYRRHAQVASNARLAAFIPASTEVRQRVLSARRLRVKTFQNQLADAQQHIAELAHENRMLRTLHKRQDSALSKYESTNAELPQLLHSHAEQIRVWQMKHRNLHSQNKELLYKLKQKESLILSLSDQNKHLTQLNKDKNLEERQRLSEKVQQLETRLQEKETDMKLLARRLQLETKNFKKELYSEQKKRKEALVQLEKVKLELSGYMKIDELNLNEKLSKLCIGSMTNINNGGHGNEDRNSTSQTILTPLNKMSNELFGDKTNRSISTDRSEGFLSTGRTARKLSANKMVVKTSTHRGDGDGPFGDDQRIFIKSVGMESTTSSQIDIDTLETKSEDNNFYDDYEDVENDNDDDEDDNEKVLEIKETLPAKPLKTDEISLTHKEITKDFKQRESFLNTFCRQTTSDSASMNVKRKSNLLAALKAIDGSTSQD